MPERGGEIQNPAATQSAPFTTHPAQVPRFLSGIGRDHLQQVAGIGKDHINLGPGQDFTVDNGASLLLKSNHCQLILYQDAYFQ